MTLHKIDREKLVEAMKDCFIHKSIDGDVGVVFVSNDIQAAQWMLQAAQNWLTITDPGFHPDKKMTEAALPWLTQWKHMNGTTKMDALRQAFKAMIAKAGE